MTVYLDCAATSPIDPRVLDEVSRYLDEDFGNAGSRTHDYGRRAHQAVEWARERVAEVVAAGRGEVVFTSGATESNNLAILGLADYGRAQGRTHLISSRIEHRAVLEPLEALTRRGFRLTLVDPEPGGWVDPRRVEEALEADTLLVSLIHVNNETGIIQPVEEVAERLGGHGAYLHVDAAQGFGKEVDGLRHPRIDLISVSGHKINAPKGAGALVTRRRGRQRPPLAPLIFGGGQELGLRPGTLPVALIAGLGKAAELALAEEAERRRICRAYGTRLLASLEPLRPELNGDPGRRSSQIANLSFPGLDAEAVIAAWKGLVAVSNGAACSSHTYTCSHVLAAMGLSAERIDGALRISWCHLSETPDFQAMVAALAPLAV